MFTKMKYLIFIAYYKKKKSLLVAWFKKFKPIIVNVAKLYNKLFHSFPTLLSKLFFYYSIFPSFPASAVTGVQAGYCPPDFTSSPLYCYKFFPDNLSWDDAVTTCSGAKASLMSITVAEEYYFMYNLMQSKQIQGAWIGLNDR